MTVVVNRGCLRPRSDDLGANSRAEQFAPALCSRGCTAKRGGGF